MTNEIVPRASGEVAIYDPEQGLQEIAVAEAAERHFRRAKDPTGIRSACAAKINGEADYAVYRAGTVATPAERGKRGGRGKKQIAVLKSALPKDDPGDVVAYRWRERFTKKIAGRIVRDEEKIAAAIDDAARRSIRICEQVQDGTVRGTAGTGEFLRFTPAPFVEAARAVLGEIDVGPASCELAQQTVRASTYFTVEDDGLQQEWHGRVFLNPPYHRDLIPEFIDKLIVERVAGRVTEAILLTNNSTDTEWFADAAAGCDAICFTYERVRFLKEDGKEVEPTQGQAFFYFGDDRKRFIECFGSIGFIVVRVEKD